MYSVKIGDLFVRSCASMRLVCLGSVCSDGCTSGGMSCKTLFIDLVFRYSCTVCEWMDFRLTLIVCSVVIFGCVSLFIV